MKDSNDESNIAKWFDVPANELKPFNADGEEKGGKTKIPKLHVVPAEVGKRRLTGWQAVVREIDRYAED